MKIFFVVCSQLLGAIFVFYGVNSLLHLATLSTQSPDQQYYYGMSLSQGFAEAILRTILGLLSIVGAIAFKKDKRWAAVTLPLIPLALRLWLVYSVYSAPKSEVSWTGDLMMLVALVLFVFFISEALYILLRKKEQPS